jgi:2-polyprenyl-3-methyl-5-hydroxy-6-metoxy-1,4-benzoquinol methylase
MSNDQKDAIAADPANGYETFATEFMRRRAQSTVGMATVRSWARSLPPGGTVLDLGCGSGVPVSLLLQEAGLAVYGIDASPTMISAFRRNLPDAHAACERIEDSRFFGQSFDGIIAVGLMFLLLPDVQRTLVYKAARSLNPGGRFLFSSPAQACAWADLITGIESRSLGAPEYQAALQGAGLTQAEEYEDEGGNHYYDSR